MKLCFTTKFIDKAIQVLQFVHSVRHSEYEHDIDNDNILASNGTDCRLAKNKAQKIQKIDCPNFYSFTAATPPRFQIFREIQMSHGSFARFISANELESLNV